jgi:integrase
MTIAHGTDPPSARILDRSTRSADGIDLVLRAIGDGHIAPQSAERLTEVAKHFRQFLLNGYSVALLSEVTSLNAAAFVRAPSAATFAPPTSSTMHFRRSALRLFFREARRLGVAATDPTLDVVLPPRSSLPCRPLADDEVLLCRSCALRTLTETRQPAAWALAEATARTSEIPHIRAHDVDLGQRRVWIHGGGRMVPRWGRLTDWGTSHLERRISAVSRFAGNPPLIYAARGSAASSQASSCIAISQTLRRAGLAREPDVRPLSLVAWAGRRAFNDGAPIEEVARMLGVRSLDSAARLIALRWSEEPSND